MRGYMQIASTLLIILALAETLFVTYLQIQSKVPVINLDMETRGIISGTFLLVCIVIFSLGFYITPILKKIVTQSVTEGFVLMASIVRLACFATPALTAPIFYLLGAEVLRTVVLFILSILLIIRYWPTADHWERIYRELKG
ncbi:hypothetical protein DA01_03515 [Dehalococcoides mccartyi]|uniref:Uncharacterized protein n=1 Tax=Dehalococcoides mccartyi TaxID=61435 RepID=A0A0V8M3X6_9CHLR|nr:hypothetical protein [Dehalococcoides mccartyi]KSV18475.1 hypothetical protein DA01_03515 [Dehalococcoides mccartyi]